MSVMKEAYDKALDEDAVMGAGDAAPAGDVSAPTASVDNSVLKGPGISRDDVLGPYQSGKGVFGKGDFNIPKNVLGKGNILKRMGYPSKKLKGHKNPYLKDMAVINEAELDRETILSIHNVKESELRTFILKFFHDEIYDAMYVQAIAYFPPTKSFFAKVENDGKWSYVNLDFKNGQFTLSDDLEVYSTEDIYARYHALGGMKVWIVWGGL